MEKRKLNIDEELNKLKLSGDIQLGEDFTDGILNLLNKDKYSGNRKSLKVTSFIILILINFAFMYKVVTLNDGANDSRKENIASLVEVFSLNN
jgi:hypothetical protein